MHYGFSTRGELAVNLHVYEEWHPEIELNLCFRDYLRNNIAVRNEYETIKYKLLQDELAFEKHNNMFVGYTLGKDSFIRKILQQVGFNRLRFLRCTHHVEWSAAKHFRQKYFF